LGESGSPPLPWECAGIPLTIQTPIETTEARAASRVQFTWFILRAKIGVYQNRNFNANWIRPDWIRPARGPEKVRICPAAAFLPTSAHEQAASADAGNRRPQIGVIEDIEKPGPELNGKGFLDSGILQQQREIDGEKPGASNRISPQATERAGSLKSETLRVVPLIYFPTWTWQPGTWSGRGIKATSPLILNTWVWSLEQTP
jgi:hypothetical protein